MAFVLVRRVTVFSSKANSYSWLKSNDISLSRASPFFGCDRGYSTDNRLHLSPLFPETDTGCMKDCRIQIMDDETWRVSSGLANAWRVKEEADSMNMIPLYSEQEDDGDGYGVANSVAFNKEDLDFDEIEDMRIRRNLFYKLDKNSREYEEYKFEFHRRKSPKNEKGRKESKENKKKENSSPATDSKTVDERRETKKKKEVCRVEEASLGRVKDDHLISALHEVGGYYVEKKQRTLTFNQQTAPYHEPFCLDIYLSKGSVRASIIHRATSNVVVVSHSISKDMKFDLSSTKNRNACVAVGEALAQRALADDIHNVVYTPRKGEKLEGKLQIVLKAVIDGGVDVKVKLKQKKLRKATGLPSRCRN